MICTVSQMYSQLCSYFEIHKNRIHSIFWTTLVEATNLVIPILTHDVTFRTGRKACVDIPVLATCRSTPGQTSYST
jgi:hypothetical protein